MKGRTVLYILAQQDFFLKGNRGRVSHAKGFCRGLLDNDNKVTVISGRRASEHLAGHQTISVKYDNVFLFVLAVFLISMKKSRESDIVVCRWKPVYSFLAIPFNFFCKEKFFFEVNSLTGVYSKNILVRFFSLMSVKLLANNFKLILMSENAKKELLKITSSKRLDCCVMPNGYFEDKFDLIAPKSSENGKANLVYFGTRQNYYDWEMLLDVTGRLINDGILDRFHVFGFDSDKYPITSHGQYDPEILRKHLLNIENPILILHADDSEVAKSGSPMKLYEYAALGLPVVISDSLKFQSSSFPSFNYYKSASKELLYSAISQVACNYSREVGRSSQSSDIAKREYSWAAVVKRW